MPGIGESSQNTDTTQQSSTSPGALGMPTVNGILGQLNPLISSSGLNPTESGAISQLTQNAQAPNPYAAPEAANATNLLNGGGATDQNPALTQNLQDYTAETRPMASNTNYDPTQNPAVQAALQAIQTQVTNSTNSQFAAAGRSGSGQNSEALGMGLAQGEAPVLLNQYNTNVANQQQAASNLYNAGNTTAGALTGTQAQANANTQTGATAATAAQQQQNYGATSTLAAQQLAQQIPAQNLGLLAQIGIPIAGLSTNTSGSGTSNSTSNPSLLSDLAQGASIASSLFSVPGGGAAPAAGATGGTSAASGIQGLLAKLSDRRAKADAVRVGTLFDGTPVYRYRYVGQNAFQIGLMADDVEKHSPEAVIEINGVKMVEYKAATEKAVHALEFGC